MLKQLLVNVINSTITRNLTDSKMNLAIRGRAEIGYMGVSHPPIFAEAVRKSLGFSVFIWLVGSRLVCRYSFG